MFTFFSTSHLVVLALTAGLSVLSIWLYRKTASVLIARGWALVLLGSLGAYIFYRIYSGYWQLRYDLPLEFCTWASLAAVTACFIDRPFLNELVYYWVFAGSIHALFTPDVQRDFPSVYFILYFVSHGVLVLIAVYLLLTRPFPGPGSFRRAWLAGQIWFFSALSVNYLLGANYGYLLKKPAQASLLDWLGPWPVYLFSLQALGLVLFFLLNLPFYFLKTNRFERHENGPAKAGSGSNKA